MTAHLSPNVIDWAWMLQSTTEKELAEFAEDADLWTQAQVELVLAAKAMGIDGFPPYPVAHWHGCCYYKSPKVSFATGDLVCFSPGEMLYWKPTTGGCFLVPPGGTPVPVKPLEGLPWEYVQKPAYLSQKANYWNGNKPPTP